MPFRSERQRRYMWANHPDIAQRWTDEHGSAPVKKDRVMPKGRAATPLKGPMKKGTGKALIAKAGGGRKALRTWRSLSKETRQGYKAKLAAGTASKGILGAMRAVRETRMKRGVSAQTNQPTTNVKTIVKQTKTMGRISDRREKREYAKTGKPAEGRAMAKAYKSRMKQMGRI